MMPCGLADVYWYFRGYCSLCHQCLSTLITANLVIGIYLSTQISADFAIYVLLSTLMQTAGSVKISINIYQATSCQVV